MANLSQREKSRYNRQVLLPGFGVEGQQKLKDASVLIAGVGGLGSPASMYLAAAGIGTIGVVDFDVVEETNLHRQIAYENNQTGFKKSDAAAERLRSINPLITVNSHDTRLSAGNAHDVLKNYNVVVDGTDNLETRYVINKTCVMLGIPYVYGSIFQYDGQTTVFNYQDGPCYSCLYPEKPAPGLLPESSETGVLGMIPGVIGSIQATETVKIIIGAGDSLSARLLVFNSLPVKFSEFRIDRIEDCSVCGKNRQAG